FMPSMAAGRGGDVESREARNWSENGSIKTNKGVNFVDSYRSGVIQCVKPSELAQCLETHLGHQW
ncbi:hypothetical protein, partial [Affinibrenneria salicis]|uniref:hypothetical protein n=1 Tax=Affinibrenneria salicis TaxID=2590031 RepID=UPI001CC73EAB